MGLAAKELVRLCGIHKTTFDHSLTTFQRLRYVQCDRADTYHLGFKTLELASPLLQRMPLRQIAHLALSQLNVKAGEAVHLVILDRLEAIYVCKTEGRKSWAMVSCISSRCPAHSTALGKALLSTAATEQPGQFLSETELTKRTERTITGPKALIRELIQYAQWGSMPSIMNRMRRASTVLLSPFAAFREMQWQPLS